MTIERQLWLPFFFGIAVVFGLGQTAHKTQCLSAGQTPQPMLVF
jgi:hypothetical protein